MPRGIAGASLCYQLFKIKLKQNKMELRNLCKGCLVVTMIWLFAACNNTGNGDADLKEPKEKNELQNASATPVISKEESKTKTIANMQAAFKGETNATARYAAFSKKADEEGYPQIAMLFKAASMSENIHAQNHKVVLEELGVTVEPVTPEVTVNSTKENLAYAVKGEAYEVEEMYPAFLKEADAAGIQLAIVSLNYAYKTEKKHRELYQQAILALESNNFKDMASVYYLCPTCGNTYPNAAAKRCGISMTNGERFIKVSTL
jgi:rubrerythrin